MLQDLARHWADKPSWTVLDISLDGGQCFSDIRRTWSGNTTKPLLHYVALVQDLPAAQAFLGRLPEAQDPAFHQIFPGFNRLLLSDGRLSLTLGVGPVSALLAELRVQADVVFLSPRHLQLADTDIKQLALNCQSGAHIFLSSTAGLDHASFARHGFHLDGALPTAGALTAAARFAPRWAVKRSRRMVNQSIAASTCAVIGAGISGAAVAHTLALRGWQVHVYDTHPSPAGGASGLPAGLCVAQTSSDESPYTRLSRQGVRICLAYARRLLSAGSDWQQTGVLEKRELSDPSKDVLHTQAAWLKPAALVESWLRPAQIAFFGNTEIASLARQGADWILKGANGQEVGRAQHVVFANAVGCRKLIESVVGEVTIAGDVLRKLAAMQSVHGSVSIGPDPNPTPAIPMNGSGSWIAGVPVANGPAWYAGASYETDLQRLQDDALQHASNLQRLQALNSAAAQRMKAALADKSVGLWRGTRCVTRDRLPLVGPVEAGAAPTLWISAGMGSRGLSLAALSAELLVACMHSEPLPVEHSLAKSLFVNRPLRGRSAQQALDLAD